MCPFRGKSPCVLREEKSFPKSYLPGHSSRHHLHSTDEDSNTHHRGSPPFSHPPNNLDKVECILQSARKSDAGTLAEKFWSSVSGLDKCEPFKLAISRAALYKICIFCM